MPAFTADHPRHTYKFYNQTVTLPHTFAPGHVLTDNEARFANQQTAGAVGNRYGASIRKELAARDAANRKAHKAGTYTGPLEGEGKKAAPVKTTVSDLNWDHQAKIEALFSEFQPGVSQLGPGSGTPSDPIEQEVRRLAGVMVRNAYKAKGIKFKDMTDLKKEDGRSAYDHHLDQTVSARGEALREQAKAQAEALRAAASDDLDLGDAAA